MMMTVMKTREKIKRHWGRWSQQNTTFQQEITVYPIAIVGKTLGVMLQTVMDRQTQQQPVDFPFPFVGTN
jgi:hypothetical protein